MLQCDQSDHVQRCEGYATAHKYNFDVLSEALGRAVISRAFVRNVDVQAYIGDLMPGLFSTCEFFRAKRIFHLSLVSQLELIG